MSEFYFTVVFKGEPKGNPYSTPYLGMNAVAWAVGHENNRVCMLTDFIDEIRAGKFESVEEIEEAANKISEEIYADL